MNNTDPLVSVIVPAYNRADVISRAINSVLAQTLQDFEIIVIDDGSIDQTADVVDRMPDVRLIRHNSNLGAAVARNSGIQVARGEWIAFLDSDDLWMPEKLERQIQLLASVPESIKACVTSLVIEYSNGGIFEKRLRTASNWYRELMMRCNLSPGATLMVSRKAFDQVGYLDTALSRYEDWDWLLRYAHSGWPIVVLDQPLARVFRSSAPNSATMIQTTKYFVDKHTRDFMEEGWFYGRKAIAKRWLEVAYHSFRSREWYTGARYLIKGICINPIQRPGYYVQILDGVLDSNFRFKILRLKSILSNLKRSR